mgnify:CR=1 FL=1
MRIVAKSTHQAVTQMQISGLFRAAYERVATVQKATHAFLSTGIVPFNPDIFSDEDFAPSQVACQDDEPTDNVVHSVDVHRHEEDNSSTNSLTSLHPLPKCKEGKRKDRGGQKSRILSSSPFKKSLLEKQQLASGRGSKTVKNSADGKQPVSVPSTSKEIPLPHQNASNHVTCCAGCGESFEEDWVQCGACFGWWHEACSTYDGRGAFVCDNC